MSIASCPYALCNLGLVLVAPCRGRRRDYVRWIALVVLTII